MLRTGKKEEKAFYTLSENDVKERTAHCIRRARMNLGINQKKLGERCFMDNAVISKYENTGTNRVDVMLNLSYALGVNLFEEVLFDLRTGGMKKADDKSNSLRDKKFALDDYSKSYAEDSAVGLEKLELSGVAIVKKDCFGRIIEASFRVNESESE